MKKLLLFTFALFLWTGAWAQNLSLGKYVHLLANGESGVTELSLQGLTNGNTTEDVQLATYDEGTSTLSPIQAFYIDLGAVKELSKVEIYWEGALCTDYSIKGSTTTGDSENPTWDIDYGTYNVARGTKHKETHDAPNNFSTRYIKFEPANNGSTEGYSNPIWTVKMKEFEVIGTDAQVLSSVKLPYYVYSATQGYNINASVYDQFDMAFEGDVTLSWEGSAPVGAEINGKNIVFGAASGVGTYTLKATDGNTSVTTPIYMVANDDALITPTSNVVPIYAAGTNTKWVTAWNGGAKEDHSFTLGTTPVQSFYDTRCVFIANDDLNDWNADVNPTLEGYKSIHFSIYSPIEGVKVNISFEGTNTIGNDHLMTLSQGWGEYSVSLVGETNIHTISIRNEQKSSSTAGPTIVVGNVYYVKNIDPSTIKSVTVTAASTSIAVGKTTQLTVTDQSSRDVTSLMTFASSNTGFATVDENGLVTAVAKGSATITATVEGNADVHSDVEITVTEAPAVILLAEGTGTTGTDGGGSAGLEYSYRIVQTGDDVTATFTCTNSESYTGLTPIIWDNTSGFVETYGNTKKMTYSVGTEIRVACKWAYAGGMSVTPYINYVVKEAEANASIAAACNDGKATPTYYSTYSNRNAFVVPADVTVSEMGVDANGKLSIVAYNTDDVVPANTGVLISSSTAGTPEFKLTGEAGTSVLGENNRLRGTSDGIDAATMAANDENCLFYRLTMHNGTDLGFWWGAAEGAAFAVAANKAYLAIPNGLAGAKDGFNIVGLDDEGETDGINKVNTLVETGVRYNLAGQRVGNDYKGIVIVNGHKVVIK